MARTMHEKTPAVVLDERIGERYGIMSKDRISGAASLSIGARFTVCHAGDRHDRSSRGHGSPDRARGRSAHAFTAGLSVLEQHPQEPKAVDELLSVVNTLYAQQVDNDHQDATRRKAG
jgi:hypothetical protein